MYLGKSSCVLLLVGIVLLHRQTHGAVIPSDMNDDTSDHTEEVLNQHLQQGDLAEEWSGQFEGDIVLSDLQENEFRKRSGVQLTSLVWPNGIVHYEIVEQDFTAAQILAITNGMMDIQRVSCVRFQPRTPTTTDFIRITGSSSGCFSFVGRQTGAQQLNLQPANPGTGCFRHGTILHELIHALGFFHMQSSTNRDQYVTIRWDNVSPGAERNFAVYGADVVTNFGTQYDYGSLMHYSATAFSSNGQRTIEPRDPAAAIGQRVWFSEDDIWRIWAMYGCTSL
ncbi:zinc metalloproteinase nas-13-like [Uranotaenia lowii]|uniref:zinc metalloproteinase nas-13-like n=1 Tax=Uranotaenia lowii TaxID=190385 RepID=UPI00247AB443|nr:zinc metalloproteinase nas-13-like [Uranotaenia lowii]